MFCGSCGKEMKADSLFCPFCGAKNEEATKQNDEMTVGVESMKVEETEVLNSETEASVELPKVAEVQSEVEEKPAFAQVEFEQPTNQPKKSSKKWKVIAAIAVVAVLIGLNFGSIAGFFIKTFGSDATYFKYVEKKAIEQTLEGVANGYERASKKSAVKGSVELKCGDDIISELEELADDEYDFGWLNTIAINYEAKQKDTLAESKVALVVDKKELIDADMIVDMEEKEMFFAVLNLSKDYLQVPLDQSEELEQMLDLMTDKKFEKALPSERAAKKMLKKYIKIVMKNLDDVEMKQKTIEIDGISQKVTVLEFELDTKTAKNIVLDVLKEVEKDKNLKKYIEDIAVVLEDHDMIDDAEDVYDDLMDGVDEAIEAIEDDDSDNETILVWTDYVNSKHEVIGRSIEVQEEEILYYATVTKGKKIATEVEIGPEGEKVVIEGSGKNRGGVISAEYDVEFQGGGAEIEIGTIILEKYNTKTARKGYLNGTIRIEPSKKIMKQLDLDDIDDLISISDLQLEVVFDSSKTKNKTEINLMNDKDLLVGVEATMQLKNASGIKTPSSRKTVDVDDADEWLESMDFDKFISQLKKTSLPDELVELVEEFIEDNIE